MHLVAAKLASEHAALVFTTGLYGLKGRGASWADDDDTDSRRGYVSKHKACLSRVSLTTDSTPVRLIPQVLGQSVPNAPRPGAPTCKR